MPSSPNILWLLTDEQRTDSVGAYGSSWAVTPNLDALAERGVRFDLAYTPSPVCVAARASMLTGYSCCRIGVLNNHHKLSPDRARFLTAPFHAAGYRVASFGKHHYNCPKPAFPVQGGRVLDDKVGYFEYRTPVDAAEFGVVRYPGPRWRWIFAGRFPGTLDETAEMENVRLALQWLEETPGQRPFFLRVSFNAPHTPVVAPAPFDSLIDPADIDLPFDSPAAFPLPTPLREHLCAHAGSHLLTEEQIRRTRQVYYGRVAFVDEVFGRLLSEMERRGALDNTIIVVTSDHGAHLGDYGFYQKQSFYEVSVRVPWLAAGPGVKEGLVVRTPVNVGSLLPTLLAAADLEVPASCDFPPLAATLQTGAPPPAAPVVSEIDFGIWDYRDGDRYVMIREGDWKLALFRDPVHQDRFPPDDGLLLHNLAADPRERRNLAEHPAGAPARRRLLALLDEWDAARRSS